MSVLVLRGAVCMHVYLGVTERAICFGAMCSLARTIAGMHP